MNIYKTTDGYADIVDLDDLYTYPQEWRDMNVHDLFLKCMSSAGKSLFYTDFLHANIDWGSQMERVIVLCRELSDIWHYTRQFQPDAYKCTLLNENEYRLALMSWLYRFEDETENQC